MKTTIDAAGRIVIPREVRRAAGLEAGMELEVRVDDGTVVIEPAPTPVRLAQKGRFTVAQPIERLPRLDGETVQRTRDQIHRERETNRGAKKK